MVANWLIGREIIEEEQRGGRAGHGAKVLADLSARLERDYGKGYSVDNLEAFRQFYLDYPVLISETASRNSLPPALPLAISDASRKLPTSKWQPGMLHPALAWSHYRSLLRVSREEVRAFYEIEAIRPPPRDSDIQSDRLLRRSTQPVQSPTS